MKILVTGGAGFIGSHLVDRLMAEDIQVVVLDNMFRGQSKNIAPHTTKKNFRFIHGDIRDYETCVEAVKGCDFVYHLAAQSNVMGAVMNLDYSFETNVVGTFNILKASKNASVQRVVFSSSRESYGEAVQIPVSEDHPLNSKNSYGASKVAGEKYCQVFSAMYDLEVVIFRFANVYGPRDFDRVIPIFLNNVEKGEDINIFGGDQFIDFVSVGIIIDALMAARNNPDINGPVNVGSGKGTTLFELANKIKELTSKNFEINVLAARSEEVVRFVASVDRFKELFKNAIPEDPLYLLPTMV